MAGPMKCYHNPCSNKTISYCILEDEVYACKDHLVGDYFWELEELDNCLHYTYPQGKSPGLMDPNIGGWLSKSRENK